MCRQTSWGGEEGRGKKETRRQKGREGRKRKRCALNIFYRCFGTQLKMKRRKKSKGKNRKRQGGPAGRTKRGWGGRGGSLVGVGEWGVVAAARRESEHKEELVQEKSFF